MSPIEQTLNNLWRAELWEQGLPAMESTRLQEGHVTFIAGKPCSHKTPSSQSPQYPRQSPPFVHWHAGFVVYSS
ncbi:hypothetical protein F7R20_01280 [Pseudomonas brassicacearum subsp. brassicacearum]|nr:hypothetical protein F7R20_01280 [Pseudomonas brassicacearum subsp. brassicacearum]PJH87307.1 hypothetical protein CVG87_21165 [Pseudomonas sp. WCS365]